MRPVPVPGDPQLRRDGKLADMDKAGGQGNDKGMCRCLAGKGALVSERVLGRPREGSHACFVLRPVDWVPYTKQTPQTGSCPHGACGLTGLADTNQPVASTNVKCNGPRCHECL